MSEEKTKETAETLEEETAEETKKEKKPEKKKTKKDKSADKIKEIEDALAEEKDKRMRLAAEYDNYRKRTSSEKLSIYDDATAKAVEELLPVADSLTMAMQNMADAPEEFKKGIELVSNQLKTSLEKLKVEAFCEIGDDFDPNLHNAVAKIESDDFEENKISAVFQKGYKIGDKIIRHAMVQVANCD
ncbi:MAG: nucleotide exchange factor GrpE [Ruminococcus sp.]|nr:nucleotide exchange factor GrpE [Ruminococcus sp.]